MSDPNINPIPQYFHVARWQAIVATVVATVLLLTALFAIAWQINSAYTTGTANTKQLDDIAVQVSEDRRQVSLICGDLREAEIELNAAQQSQSATAAELERVQALLWNRSYKEAYPPNAAYVANIIQPQQTACK